MNLLESFMHAGRGIYLALKEERNLKIHLIAFVLVVCFGFYFSIANHEWIALMGVSALVISLELINSAIERLCDLYSELYDPKIRMIKDIAAGAVLVAAVFAMAVGLIVFLPYFV